MGSQEARRADIVLTSLDDERRQQAVAVVKRCLDVASEYGAQAIVLHLGQTHADPELEQQLKQLILDGRRSSPEAKALRSRILIERATGRAERMDSLRRGLDELVPYASSRGVRLGLENRPICQVPNFEDMGQVLTWFPDDTLGYWHDTGHAQVQEALGFTPQADWLRAYGDRLMGGTLEDLYYDDAIRRQGTRGLQRLLRERGLDPCLPLPELQVTVLHDLMEVVGLVVRVDEG